MRHLSPEEETSDFVGRRYFVYEQQNRNIREVFSYNELIGAIPARSNNDHIRLPGHVLATAELWSWGVRWEILHPDTVPDSGDIDVVVTVPHAEEEIISGAQYYPDNGYSSMSAMIKLRWPEGYLNLMRLLIELEICRRQNKSLAVQPEDLSSRLAA